MGSIPSPGRFHVPQGKLKNTGMGSLSLLQVIFPSGELNQGLLHCRWILYQLSCQGSPPVPKKGNDKECSNYCTIVLIPHSSKVMLKILQVRLQQYVTQELPDVQVEFRKGRGSRDQIANIHCITEKSREFQKNIYFCFIDYAKAFNCVDHNKLKNS